MDSEFDVVTMGSATVDLFADSESELIRIDTPRSHESLIAFPLGSKVLVNELEIQTGGGGTNTATTFTRLGLKTGYVGKIGDDANGAEIKTKLAAEGITFLGGESGVSGVSVVLNSFAKDRVILAYKGTNNNLLLEDVQPFTCKWIYLSSLMEQSLETAKAVIARTDCKVAFNPSNYQAEMGHEVLADLLEHVDLLVLNREEANKLMGLDYTQEASIESLFQTISVLPPQMIVITDGSAGAYIYDRKKLYHAAPSDDLEVLETTGAGDAFASSLTAALVYELDIEMAIRWAVSNAESVLRHRGAKEKLLRRDELLSDVENRAYNIRTLSLD